MEKEGVKIRILEHLLAALAGLGIDNACLELYGEEVPMADGSAQTWIQLLQKAGTVELQEKRAVRKLVKPIWVEDGERL